MISSIHLLNLFRFIYSHLRDRSEVVLKKNAISKNQIDDLVRFYAYDIILMLFIVGFSNPPKKKIILHDFTTMYYMYYHEFVIFFSFQDIFPCNLYFSINFGIIKQGNVNKVVLCEKPHHVFVICFTYNFFIENVLQTIIYSSSTFFLLRSPKFALWEIYVWIYFIINYTDISSG